MTITVSAEGMGFAVFQVGNAGNQVGILARNMLSVRKVCFGSFIKHVNRNSLPKCLKTLAKQFTNWGMLWMKYGHIHVIVSDQWPGLLSAAGWLTVLGHFHALSKQSSLPAELQCPFAGQKTAVVHWQAQSSEWKRYVDSAEMPHWEPVVNHNKAQISTEQDCTASYKSFPSIEIECKKY